MARPIMIQGTMSNAGKSLLATGMCRVLAQDGYRVAPFKSQNMALNSFVTREGLEMGRAQAVQAYACGIEPDVCMNPILLKPTTDMGSQVIVNGEIVQTMSAGEYFRRKREYVPAILEAYRKLDERFDIIVIEGAGSPAEINLKKDDIVNMGLAELVDAPVLLVGDIDRGGVFAQLVGTVMLLEPRERERIQGLIINKFRGDIRLLEPGLTMLSERCGKRVLGVVPYADVDIEAEDSLAEGLQRREAAGPVDIAVIRLPRISNFTDLQAFSLEPAVSVRYVERAAELGQPDLIVVPGTKSTIADMEWLRRSGIESAILGCLGRGSFLIGICGGYQMLGRRIVDENGVEGKRGSFVRGMGVLPVETCFARDKARIRTEGETGEWKGALSALSHRRVSGYEIHMGRTYPLTDGDGGEEAVCFAAFGDRRDGCVSGQVMGTYLHGVFDEEEFRSALVRCLCERKGIPYEGGGGIAYDTYRERQYDRLADILRESLDWEEIFRRCFKK